jgi:hypothetical protein
LSLGQLLLEHVDLLLKIRFMKLIVIWHN